MKKENIKDLKTQIEILELKLKIKELESKLNKGTNYYNTYTPNIPNISTLPPYNYNFDSSYYIVRG